MRTISSAFLPSCLAAALALTAWSALAQPAALNSNSAPADKPKVESKVEPKVESIHHQDKSVAIDEVRVGGQTQSIEVQPSNEKLRPYQVEPQKGDAGIADKNNGKGLTNRSWKLFDF